MKACLAGLALLAATARADPAPPVASSACATLIQRHGDRYSASLHEAPLEAALRELGRCSGVEVVLPAAPAEPVSARFDRLDAAAAFGTLLHGRNFALFYRAQHKPGAPPQLAKVRVYPATELAAAGAAASEAPAPSAARAAPAVADDPPVPTRGFIPQQDVLKMLKKRLDEEPGGFDVSSGVVRSLAQKLESGDTGERRDVVDVFRRIGGPDVIEPLTRALNDPDEQVRQTAADALRENGERLRDVAAGGPARWTKE